MKADRIGIIGLGEFGRVLTEDILHHSRAEVRIWDYQFDRVASAAARNLKDFRDHATCTVATDSANAAEGCQAILSVVTADQALSAARSVIPSMAPGTWFVDLNSVSPQSKSELSDLIGKEGGKFVEASVMSPVAPFRMASPILLAGPHADSFREIGRGLGFSNTHVISENYGEAAATKMCRSVIVKGIEALVTESLLTARHYGVESSVLASLENIFPGPNWTEHAHYLISRSLLHGERRAAEMGEVRKTVEQAGLEPWMSDGSARRHAWAPRFESAQKEESLEGLLDSILRQLEINQIEGER